MKRTYMHICIAHDPHTTVVKAGQVGRRGRTGGTFVIVSTIKKFKNKNIAISKKEKM